MKRAVPLLFVLLAAAPAFPAAQPSDPDFWLDRAAADIASIPDHPPPQAICSPLDLAGMLVEDRGSDADRQLLRAALGRYRPAPGPDPAVAHARYTLNAAYARVLLGDRREAGLLANDVVSSIPAKTPRLTRLSIEISLAMVFARLGDDARAFDLSAHAGDAEPFLGKTFAYAELSRAYDDLGKEALADRSRRLAESAAHQSADRTNLAAVIKLYASTGDYPSAVKLLDALPNDFHRSDALVEIARAQYRAGLSPDAADTLRRAADVLSNSESADTPSFFWAIARTAAEWRDKDLFLRLAPRVERVLETSRGERPFYLPRLAQGYATFGDSASCRRLADLAAAEPVTGEDAARHAAIRDVLLAAALARSGDVDGSMSALDRVIRSGTLSDSDWSEYGYAVPESLADAGRFDDARAAAGKVFVDPADLSLLHRHIATRLTDLHRYGEAWTAASQIPWARVRVGLFRRIASAELAADPLAAQRHVDSIQTPWERAMTNLGVAESLAHVPPTGSRRLFDPNSAP